MAAILVLIAGAVIGAAVWYWRARGVEAADDVVEAVGQARGAYKRRAFRQKVNASTLTSIDDPALGAAVFLVSLTETEHGLRSEHETAISRWLHDVAQVENPVESIIYAKWAIREVSDTNEVIRRLLPLWRRHLDESQRRDLIQAASEIARIGGGPDPLQVSAIKRLHEALTH
jgi:uncharacterized tellurite resistance protein B-like protein